VRAVMEAAGSERAAVMGESEGGPLAMLFAAAHPERTAALILQEAEVRERTDVEWPWGESTEDDFEAAMATLPERWGKGSGIRWIAPSLADQKWAHEWWGASRSTRALRAQPRPSCAWHSTSTCAMSLR